MAEGRPGDAVLLVDGQVTGYVARSAHWPIARQIAADLAARPGEGPRVAAWYRATAALMQEWRSLDLLGMHLEAGQTLFVDDPVLALYQGTLRQVFADPRLYDYLRKRGSSGAWASRHWRAATARRLTCRAARPDAGSGAKHHQDRARSRQTRTAPRADARPDAARGAHPFGARPEPTGRRSQAVEVVGPALEAPLSPFLEFYAALILGRSEEQLGHFAEAGVAYARAAARFPGAQSAEIGRSRVALAQGRAPDALKILVEVAGPSSTEEQDPWSRYWQHEPDADTLLQAWRADSEVMVQPSRPLRTLDGRASILKPCRIPRCAVAAMRSVAFVVLLALLPSIGDGQTAPPRTEKEKSTRTVTRPFAQTLVEQWTTAVNSHAAGTVDQPLKTVASWPPEHVTLVVRLVVEQVHRLLEARDAGRDFVYTQELAELTARLMHGLSLHTDIAIVERTATARPAPDAP